MRIVFSSAVLPRLSNKDVPANAKSAVESVGAFGEGLTSDTRTADVVQLDSASAKAALWSLTDIQGSQYCSGGRRSLSWRVCVRELVNEKTFFARFQMDGRYPSRGRVYGLRGCPL
jgi:hypothetical protein